MMRPLTVVSLALLATLIGCGEDGGGGVDLSRPVTVDLEAPAARLLSEYNLFKWDPNAGFTYHEDVVPYDLNTALFSDYALKSRAIYVPDGQSMTYVAEGPLDFPVGAVIIKNFYFPADFREPDKNLNLVETRLIIRAESGYVAYPYIWLEDQSDAVYSPAGEVRPIDFINEDGETQTAKYLVPQKNQCASCHAQFVPGSEDTVILPIGPKARHLYREHDYGGDAGVVEQLTHFAELGMLKGLPALDTITPAYDFRPIEEGGVAAIPAGDVERAARDYLDINCAHCHNPNGPQGVTSQLFLNHDNTDYRRWGICKKPGSAGAGTGGYVYDVVPGEPEISILDFRVRTEEVGAMMPLIGRSLTHDAGSQLVDAWIAALNPADYDTMCNSTPVTP